MLIEYKIIENIFKELLKLKELRKLAINFSINWLDGKTPFVLVFKLS